MTARTPLGAPRQPLAQVELAKAFEDALHAEYVLSHAVSHGCSGLRQLYYECLADEASRQALTLWRSHAGLSRA
jgi:hypothetical protein